MTRPNPSAPLPHGEQLTSRQLTPEHRRWRWMILGSTYLSYVGYYFCRKAYGVLKAPIGDDLGFGPEALAHIWTAFLAAYMVGQFLNGAIGRRTGSRILLLIGMAITLGCNIVFGFAQTYWTFLGFMVVNGLAQSSGWPGNVAAVAPWLRSHERGTFMGVWSTCYVTGNLGVKLMVGFVLANVKGVALAYAAWRISFWACALVILGIWLVFLVFQRNTPEDVGLSPILDDEGELNQIGESAGNGTTRPPKRKSYFSVLFTPTVLMMAFIFFFLKFLRYALDSWTAYLLNQSLDVAPSRAAIYTTVFDFAGVAGMIVTGILLDRVFHGKWRLLCLVMCVGMTGAFVFASALGSLHAYYLIAAYGLVGFMIYGPDSLLVGTAAIDVGGRRETITAVGIINGLGSIGPIFQEEIIGYLFERYRDLTQINMLFTGISAFASLLLLVLYLRGGARGLTKS